MTATAPAHDHGSSYEQNKADLLTRLKKIEGQVRGIQRMIEQDSYCVDVLTQISAVVSASERVGLRVLEDHIRECVAGALTPEGREEKLAELNQILKTFLQVGHSAVGGSNSTTTPG